MNIMQAKGVPIGTLMEKLGLIPAKQQGKEVWYLSPFREEKTPSFHVNVAKNIWFDFGEGKGGNVIDFASYFLERTGKDSSVSDALSWLKASSGDLDFPKTFKPQRQSDNEAEKPKWVVTNERQISHQALVKYLETRNIPFDIAKSYLKEIQVHNPNADNGFFALGFKNEEGGFEIRNQVIKASTSPKAITFIRGFKPKPEGIHLFEGWSDFLSTIARLKTHRLKGDSIVLNSVGLLKQAEPYIRGYGYRSLYSWMDNDRAGEKITLILDEFAKSEEGLRHVPMNKIYAPFKDVNDWHVNHPYQPSQKQKLSPD